MTYTFKPSESSDATRQIMVAFAGASGSGKTWSALELATGLAGNERFAVIDTEAGRALHYKEFFKFDHCDFGPDFSPERTGDVILEAASKYPVVIVDSMSHEYAGVGGISDMHEDALEKLAKGNESRFEALSGPAWKGPKIAHKKMMARLSQCRSHLIFCLRAEPKIRFVKEKFTRQDGSTGEKTVIVDAGFQPICEKMFMYEMLASFMFYADKPGLAVPIKLQEQHKAAFPDGQKVGRRAGEVIAAWARGAAPQPKPASAGAPDVDLVALATSAAALGTARLEAFFKAQDKAGRLALKPHLDKLKQDAAAVDAAPDDVPFDDHDPATGEVRQPAAA